MDIQPILKPTTTQCYPYSWSEMYPQFWVIMKDQVTNEFDPHNWRNCIAETHVRKLLKPLAIIAHTEISTTLAKNAHHANSVQMFSTCYRYSRYCSFAIAFTRLHVQTVRCVGNIPQFVHTFAAAFGHRTEKSTVLANTTLAQRFR